MHLFYDVTVVIHSTIEEKDKHEQHISNDSSFFSKYIVFSHTLNRKFKLL